MAVEYTPQSGESQMMALAAFQHVARLAEPALARTTGKSAPFPTDVKISAPHEVHNVGLDHLVARRSLTDVEVTGWRYLVMVEGDAVASSEVAVGTGGQSPSFEQVNVGPYVQSTASALQELNEIPEVQSGRYEPHLLQIPALSTCLLWLRQMDGATDLFMALSPAPEFLHAKRIYHEDELIDLLEGPARRCSNFDDSPDGGQV